MVCAHSKQLLVVQEYDRPNSAYMLFYERSEALEPVERLRAAASAAANPGANAWAPPADEAAVSATEQPSEVHPTYIYTGRVKVKPEP